MKSKKEIAMNCQMHAKHSCIWSSLIQFYLKRISTFCLLYIHIFFSSYAFVKYLRTDLSGRPMIVEKKNEKTKTNKRANEICLQKIHKKNQQKNEIFYVTRFFAVYFVVDVGVIFA